MLGQGYTYTYYLCPTLIYLLVLINANNLKVGDRCQINRTDSEGICRLLSHCEAASREFPHSALLGYKKLDGQMEWFCGGSLVSTRYVLTAGHCQKSRAPDVVNVSHVRLGELVLNDASDDATVIDVSVERFIQNPSYRISQSYHDIALLRLGDKVILSPYIRPICLPTVDLVPTKSIATGWGTVGFSDAISNALLKVVLESYNNTECNDILKYNIEDRKLRNGIIETQLCAGSRTERKDTCQGDSGGPLLIYHPILYCMYTQVGVTSYGFGCGTINFPGIYTRVFYYVQWIESVIWAPGEDD